MQSFSIPALPDIRSPTRRRGTAQAPEIPAADSIFGKKSLYLHRMATKEGFTIEISSRYEGWWRYNVALMCGCFDTAGNRTGFASTEAHVADVGSNLREKARRESRRRPPSLETGPCDHLLLYTSISYPIRCRPATTSATRHPSKSKSASHTADGGSARRNASSTSGRAPRSRCAWIRSR